MKKTGQANSAKQTGQVRIIGGNFRGRKLPVLLADGLRPTSDRVRETVFNWLQFDVAGRSCLDVFAGTGALGFEALSRGAMPVVMLEKNVRNQQQLLSNQQMLKVEGLSIHPVDALSWLSQASQISFDLIFLDPPFGLNLMEPTLELIFKNGYIQPKAGRLYLEQEKHSAWPSLLVEQGWHCVKEKTTAQVRYGLFCPEAL